MTAPSTPRLLRLAGLPRRLAIAACAGLLCTAVAPALNADATVAPASVDASFSQVFSDDFTGTSINKSLWSLYNNVSAAPAHSARNVVVHDGMLTLKTAYDSTLGKWTTAGLCLCGTKAPARQLYGSYEIRTRVSAGDSRAVALLWPEQGWPPEVDFMEMGGTGTQGTRQLNTQTVHYGHDNSMIHTSQTADFTQWHTVGVQWGPGYIRYLLDGAVTNTVVTSSIPAQHMHLGLQTAPMSGAKPTVPVNFDVDWVHQLSYVGAAGAAPATPTNVSATSGDTSATVSWTAPANTGNSLLSSYRVTAQPGGQSVTVARSGTSDNDPATKTTFTGLTPGVNYSFTVAATNPFGSSGNSLASAPIAPTGTAPTIDHAPTAAFLGRSTLGTTASASDLPMRVSWSAVAGSTPICKQNVVRQLSASSDPLKVKPTARSLTDSMSGSGSVVTYVAQATGCNGLSSPAVAGPTYHYQLIQQNAAGVTYTGTWSTVACGTCSGGSAAEAKAAGASVSFPVTNAYGAALVVKRGPSQSPFKVYVDGTLVGTYYPAATTVSYRSLMFTTSWATPGAHKITVVNGSATGKTLLDVDAMAALTT